MSVCIQYIAKVVFQSLFYIEIDFVWILSGKDDDDDRNYDAGGCGDVIFVSKKQ